MLMANVKLQVTSEHVTAWLGHDVIAQPIESFIRFNLAH